MGGDGGTVATGRRFTRGATKNKEDVKVLDKASEEARALIRSTSCALTSKPLAEPIVCCKLGYLYNKEDILTALLEKKLDEEFSHVRKIKDVVNCKLTKNPAFKENVSDETRVSRFICPFTQLELNGKYPFVVLLPSGRVVSERAVKELENITENETALSLWPTKELADKRRKELKFRKLGGKKEQKNKRKCIEEMNDAVSKSTSKVVKIAQEKVEVSKQASETYTSLFGKDANDDSSSPSRLFMIGNPRGYVRT